MSKFKSLLLLNFLLALLAFILVGTISASAFSDDFNGCDLSQWTLTAGWSCTNAPTSLDGTNYSLVTSVAGWATERTATYTGLSGTEKYFEVTMRSNYSFTGSEYQTTGEARFLFLNNGTNYITATIGKTGVISTTYFSDYAGTARSVYRLVFTLTGTSLNRKIYTSGTLLNDATATISVPTYTNRIVLVSYVTAASGYTSTLLASFDNIVAQTYVPYSSPSIINWGNSITNNQNTTIYIP